MPAEFHVNDPTPERIALAADLIASGRSVDFGGYELTVSGEGELVVAILTEDPDVGPEVEEARTAVENRLDATLRAYPVLSAFLQLPRRYELVVEWGKGATWLGYWSPNGFRRGRPPVA